MLKFPQLTNNDKATIQASLGVLKVVDRVEENLNLLAFDRCRDYAKVKYNTVNGMADGYQDQSGVNTLQCVNAVYDSTNKLYSPSYGGIDSYSKLVLQFDNVSATAPAIYFDGTGDYLELANSSDWNFGSGDFTIEFWFRTDNAVAGMIISRTSNATFFIIIESSAYIRFLASSNAIDINANSPTGYVVAGKWIHYAISRQGTTFRTFINGSLNRTVTDVSTAITSGSDVLRIGYAFSGNYYSGYLREIRISKGIARYTADFTPSTSGFTADAYTVLYIKGNESNGATSFTDYETTPKTITTVGDTKIRYIDDYRSINFVDQETTAKVPYPNSSTAKQMGYMIDQTAAWFNNSGSYILVPGHSDFSFGTGDFTIEFWVNLTTHDAEKTLFRMETGAHDLALTWHTVSGGRLDFDSPGAATHSELYPTTLNTWIHMAIVKSSRNYSLYVQGRQLGSSWSDLSESISAGDWTFGATAGSPATAIHGWMKEIRISNVARYTSTFTPSTTAFNADSSTKLLLHCSSSATAPLGPAIYMDGSGDAVYAADHADWDFGTGNFTIEGWVRWSAFGSSTYLVSRRTGSSGNMCDLRYASGTWTFFINSSSVVAASYTAVLNKWYHWAIVRSGTNCYIFLDGRQIGSTGTSSANIVEATPLYFGDSDWGGAPLNGWLREIRVSNVARYTSAFTPSSSGFVVDSNTKLYIKGNESNGSTTFFDYETTPKTITTVGQSVIKYTEDYRSCIFLDSSTTAQKYPYSGGSAKVDFVSASGAGSAVFNHSVATNAILYASHLDWNLGPTGGGYNFTIDMYVRFTQLVTNDFYGLVSADDNGSNGWKYYYQHPYYIALWNGSSIRVFGTSGVTFVAIDGVWYHLAFVRSGTTVYLYVNGQSVASIVDDDYNNDSQPLGIGTYKASAPQASFGGLMDMIRISKGVARYTATFTPPTTAFEGIQNMSIVSQTQTALRQPNTMRLVLHQENVDAITLNTDLLAYVSRDGGTTYNQVTLRDAGYYDGTKRVLTGIASVALQPAGTSPVYKVVTANNKNLKLYGAELNWE